jgi:thiol-disulfide isomerase/thioredoxin
VTVRVRWALLAVVVVVAAAVALWPWLHPEGGRPTPPVATPSAPPVNLAPARAAAALRPCPAARQDAAPTGPLRGVTATCLGDGRPVDLGAALAGRPALINVWAAWCEPCREELPALQTYADSPGAVQVLGVQVQSAPADGLRLLTDLGVHLPAVADQDGAVTRAVRLPGYLPVSYVLRPDGSLHQVQPPTPFESAEQVRGTVSRYLGVAP